VVPMHAALETWHAHAQTGVLDGAHATRAVCIECPALRVPTRCGEAMHGTVRVQAWRAGADCGEVAWSCGGESHEPVVRRVCVLRALREGRAQGRAVVRARVLRVRRAIGVSRCNLGAAIPTLGPRKEPGLWIMVSGQSCDPRATSLASGRARDLGPR